MSIIHWINTTKCIVLFFFKISSSILKSKSKLIFSIISFYKQSKQYKLSCFLKYVKLMYMKIKRYSSIPRYFYSKILRNKCGYRNIFEQPYKYEKQIWLSKYFSDIFTNILKKDKHGYPKKTDTYIFKYLKFQTSYDLDYLD